MCVRVLRQNCPHGISQLKQVLRVLPTRAGRGDNLVCYLLQRGGAEVVWIVVGADVEQYLAGRRRKWRTGVKGHRDDLITTFFSVVKVTLHFLLPARRQLVGHAPNARLKRQERRKRVVCIGRKESGQAATSSSDL